MSLVLVLFLNRLFPLTVQPYLFLGVVLAWSLSILNIVIVIPSASIRLSFLLFLLTFPIGLLVSTNPIRSWQVVAHLIVGVALFVSLINSANSNQRSEWIAWGIALLGIGLLLLEFFYMVVPEAYPSLFFVIKPSIILLRSLDDTINPNVLSGALIVTIPISVAYVLLYFQNRRWLRFLFYFVCCVLEISMITWLQSRGALWGVMIALMLMLILNGAYGSHQKSIFFCVLPLTIYTILNVQFNSPILSGLDERLEIWQRALLAIQEFPLTGIGIGNFAQYVAERHPYTLFAPNVSIPHAHNLFLQVAVDLGIPGLISYLVLLAKLAQMLGDSLKEIEDMQNHFLRIGAAGALVAMLIHGMIDVPMWDSKLAFLPWLLFALIVNLQFRSCKTAAMQSV